MRSHPAAADASEASRISSADLLACATAAARAAGEYALAHRDRRGATIRVARHDLKLRMDVECQAEAIRVIQSAYPDHAVLGEESADAPVAAGHALLWIVDPLDGTINYSHGLPFWCASVAVRRGDAIVAGAVHAPVMRETYTAACDGPALCNGAPIRVSGVSDLARALVNTGIDRHSDTGVPSMEIFRRIAGAVQRPRLTGSAALDICHVACGRVEGYFESGVFLWDVAAGGLIVERAGGKTELLASQGPAPHRVMFMATNGLIHDALRQLILSPAQA